MPRDLPLFPLELVLVPGEPLPLHIFEPRYQELLDRCVDSDEPFVLVLQDEQGMRELGCTAEITDVMERFPDGRANIATLGREVCVWSGSTMSTRIARRSSRASRTILPRHRSLRRRPLSPPSRAWPTSFPTRPLIYPSRVRDCRIS
jgi:hypothetical protein